MSFWSILLNIFEPSTNSKLKKDDDYYLPHHLAVMEEIYSYKRCDIRSLSDSEIQTISENVYSIAIDSGEKYSDSDMLIEELKEIKKTLLIQDRRIRKSVRGIIRRKGYHRTTYNQGLEYLKDFIYSASIETMGLKKGDK